MIIRTQHGDKTLDDLKVEHAAENREPLHVAILVNAAAMTWGRSMPRFYQLIDQGRVGVVEVNFGFGRGIVMDVEDILYELGEPEGMWPVELTRVALMTSSKRARWLILGGGVSITNVGGDDMPFEFERRTKTND